MDEFRARGLLEELRRAQVDADVLLTDAHLGYYLNRTVVDRLQADVLRPARDSGYRRIILVGISLGGAGALLNERDYPGTVDGIVLLAPFVGNDKKVLAEVAAASSAEAWAAHRDLKSGKVTEQIWTFLGQRSASLPETWLLSGDRDYLREGQQLLAERLPPDHVWIRPGKHTWKTWHALWAEFCRTSPMFAQERAAWQK
jgi:alpha-beta hydrolase superfamily lysophospholipase